MAKIDYSNVPTDVVKSLLEQEMEKRNNSTLVNNIKMAKRKHSERQKLRAEVETHLITACSKRACEAVLLESDDPKALNAARDAKALAEASKIVNDSRTFVSRAAAPAIFGALGAGAVILTEKATRTGLIGTGRDAVSGLVKRMFKKS